MDVTEPGSNESVPVGLFTAAGKPATYSFCLQTLTSLPSIPTTTTQVCAFISCLIYCSSLLTDPPAFSPICTTLNPFSILHPRVIFLKRKTVHVISPFKTLQQLLTALRSKSKFLTLLSFGFFPSTHLSTNPPPQTLYLLGILY